VRRVACAAALSDDAVDMVRRRRRLACGLGSPAAAGRGSSARTSSVSIKGDPMSGFPVPAASSKVRVINLWAVWCGPCRQEAPVLGAAHAQLTREGVEFISVNANDDAGKAAQFARQHGWTWPQLYDKTGSMLLARRFVGMPDTLIVNRSGDLTGYFLGPVRNVDSLARAVAQAQR
jgi:thiol-disulfide isomerase/thioredoxin